MNVEKICHAEVVQLLKDTPINQEATFRIKRLNEITSDLNNYPSKPNKYLQRSKTPTSEMLFRKSSFVLPSRSKTPHIDSREKKNLENNFLQQTLKNASHVNIVSGLFNEEMEPKTTTTKLNLNNTEESYNDLSLLLTCGPLIPAINEVGTQFKSVDGEFIPGINLEELEHNERYITSFKENECEISLPNNIRENRM